MQYKYVLLVIAAVLALEVVNVSTAQVVQPANAPAVVTSAPAVTGNVAPSAPKKKHKKKKDKPTNPADAPPTK
jgi:hypothetical protein